MTILDEIIEYKKVTEIPGKKQVISPSGMRQRARQSAAPESFIAKLMRDDCVALIAEIKKASPSRGLLCPDFRPVALARSYAQNGAAAISVLTDTKYFQGHLGYLEDINRFRGAEGASIGILRKDFIVDPYQIYESRAAGADALLLIMAALNDADFEELLHLTWELGMEALVEVHNRAELDRALALRPNLIGVNNRDLRDFTVDINTCLSLRTAVPPGIGFVAESGIHDRHDVERLGQAGVHAILVGESLVTADDPGAQVRLLTGVPRKEAIE
jgi:indole-3-glycerol phosphate synthase